MFDTLGRNLTALRRCCYTREVVWFRRSSDRSQAIVD